MFMCFCRGFQSSSTADLMLKRSQRQKKLHTDALKKKKLSGVSLRYESLFLLCELS